MNTRDRILDTAEEILIERGIGGATVENIALKTGISKGGLLYHFGSKIELYKGILDRLCESALANSLNFKDSDLVTAVSKYLENSSEVQDALSRSLMAALQLMRVEELDVKNKIRQSLDLEFEQIACRITDPVLVRKIQLLSDGIYLRALIGDFEAISDSVMQELINEVLSQVKSLTN